MTIFAQHFFFDNLRSFGIHEHIHYFFNFCIQERYEIVNKNCKDAMIFLICKPSESSIFGRVGQFGNMEWDTTSLRYNLVSHHKDGGSGNENKNANKFLQMSTGGRANPLKNLSLGEKWVVDSVERFQFIKIPTISPFFLLIGVGCKNIPQRCEVIIAVKTLMGCKTLELCGTETLWRVVFKLRRC